MNGGSGMSATGAVVSPAPWSMGMQLIRPRLTVAVAASSLAGALSFPAPLPSAVFPAVMGVLLLAAAGSTLNQIQERQSDARMARTCNRPFACGQLSPRSGALFTILLLLAGGALLLVAGGLLPTLLGFAGLLLYNGVYTPLKRHSSFAILPGAFCGALPPIIGWSAAGGLVGDFRILLPAGLFFLWQVPHFWLLAGYRRQDYHRAGLPTIFARFGLRPANRVLLAWLLALAAAAAILPSFGIIAPPLAWPWLLLSLGLLSGIAAVLWLRPVTGLPHLFFPLNLFIGLFMLALALQGMLR